MNVFNPGEQAYCLRVVNEGLDGASERIDFLQMGDEDQEPNPVFTIKVNGHLFAWELLKALRLADDDFQFILGEFFEIGWNIGIGNYLTTSFEDIKAEQEEYQGFCMVAHHYHSGHKDTRVTCALDGRMLDLLEADDVLYANMVVTGYPREMWALLNQLETFHYGAVEYPISNMFEDIVQQAIDLGKASKAET
jgi:hypothetical protein